MALKNNKNLRGVKFMKILLACLSMNTSSVLQSERNISK